MQHERFDGLIAATVTPMDASGALALDRLPPLVEKLSADGVVGMFACGSTGEGLSLTIDERQATLEATLALARGRMRTIAHVGHNSLAAAADLARHAQAAGADAVAATSPSYFKPPDITTLVDSMAAVAEAAPALPFYYYHIPGLTHVSFDMVAFLAAAGERIPNLVGLKYTHPTLHEFQACRQLAGQRFEMLWGVDEMLAPACSVGAAAAVGSTYNVAAPLYRQIITDLRAGRWEEANRGQERAIALVRLLARFPFHPALKEMLCLQGVEVGPCRLPFRRLTDAERSELAAGLRTLQWLD